MRLITSIALALLIVVMLTSVVSATTTNFLKSDVVYDQLVAVLQNMFNNGNDRFFGTDLPGAIYYVAGNITLLNTTTEPPGEPPKGK